MQKNNNNVAKKYDKNVTKTRILAVCVRLFIEKGYYKTTLSGIVKEAGVSFSSFQNLFHTKDGVLLDLAKIMFDGQFDAAREVSAKKIDPVFIYAAETAIQITITELSNNLREIYVEAYSNPDATEYLCKCITEEAQKIFSKYNPELEESDFYELVIGSSGLMRGYMARPCDQYFTLEKKLRRFLTSSFKIYNIPDDTINEAVEFVLNLDIKGISNKIMHDLFTKLEMQFDFKLDESLIH